MTFKIVIHDAMSSLRLRMETRMQSPTMMMRGIINEAAISTRMTIWAWDAPGGNDKRRKIFPGYKNRPPAATKTYQNLDLLRELLSHTNAWQARLAGFEGDDVIARLVEEFRGKAPIEIITRDGDLTALCGPGVTCRAKAPASPNLIRLYKVTVGDKSDTIPGIPGFGPKDWEKADKQVLADVIGDPDFCDEAARAAGLRPPHINWLRKHQDELAAMKTIIEPLPMTDAEFNQSLTQGTDNPTAREAIMKRYLL